MAPTPAFGDINTGTYGILPAENAHNFGEDVTFRHRLIEVGPRLSDISFDNFRVTPGVSFDIGENWKAETAFMFNSDESLDVKATMFLQMLSKRLCLLAIQAQPTTSLELD